MNKLRSLLSTAGLRLQRLKSWGNHETSQTRYTIARLCKIPVLLMCIGAFIGTAVALHFNTLSAFWMCTVIGLLAITPTSCHWIIRSTQYKHDNSLSHSFLIDSLHAWLYTHHWRVALFMVSLLVGWLWSTQRWDHDPDPLHLSATDRRLVQLEGEALYTPHTRYKPNTALAPVYQPAPVSRFTFHAQRLITNENSHPVNTRLQITVYSNNNDLRENDPVQQIHHGTQLRITGWVRDLREPDNPGAYDFSKKARQRGITGRMAITDTDHLEVVKQPNALSPWAWFQTQRSKMRAWLLNRYDTAWQADTNADPARDLIALLILGDRPEMDRDLEMEFRQAGLAHLLAISGLHLGLLAFAAWGLTRLMGGGPRMAAWVTFTLASIYVLGLPDRPSITRAYFMLSAVCLSMGFGRRWSTITMLGWVAFALWLIEPAQIFDAGFQLSFGVTMGIILVVPRLSQACVDALKLKPRLIFRHRVYRYMLDYIMVGLVAWMFASPLILTHFGELRLMAFPMSLLVTPLIPLLLVVGFAQLGLIAIHPTLGMPLTILLRPVSQVVITLAQWRPLPTWLNWSFPSAGLIWVFIAISSMLWTWRDFQFRWRGLLLRSIVWLILLGWLTYPVTSDRVELHRQVEINMLAVGDGSCYVIRHRGEVWIYDGGSRTFSTAGRTTLLPALRQMSVRRVDRIFISHPDSDHYNALGDVITTMPVGEIITTPRTLETAKEQKTLGYLMQLIEEAGIPVHLAQRGDQWHINEMSAVCLWPDPAVDTSQYEDNELSLTLKLTYGRQSILFMGDTEDRGVAQLLKKPEELEADIMELPHHGSWTDQSEVLLYTVNPKIILHSRGGRGSSNRKFNDPWTQHMEGRMRLLTDEVGWSRLRLEKNGKVLWQVQHPDS